ncbi:MAG: type II secretion system protein GspN [Leptospiraceae bacterium]|nr:type II secretion system protein GspN [Leptospiraceae bacterium]
MFLFPYEELTRTFITKNAQEKGYVLEFRKLNLSLFSTKSVDHLIYQTSNNLEVRAESIEIDTSIWDLIKKNFKGNVKVTSLNLEMSEFALKASSVNLEDSSLIGFDRDLTNMSISTNLQIFDGTILRSPVIPMIDTLQGVTIKSILLNLKKTLNSNRLNIEKGVFTLSIAKITISGYIELAASMRDSRLDLKVCPKLTEKYSIEREDIASSLQLITKDMPEGCIPVTGTIGSPKVNMPGIQQPPPTSPSILAPVPENSPIPNEN